MSADVISYHEPHGKRGDDPGLGRRGAIVVVAALAVAAATWLQRSVSEAPMPAPAPLQAPEPIAAAPAPLATPETAAPTPAPIARRPARRGPAPIPLDAHAEGFGEDLEILSAAELDAISQ